MSKILRLTPGAEESGLITFRLGLWVDDKEVAKWSVNSGARGAQLLRTYNDPKSRPGNLEPIPEREYKLGYVEFAGEHGTWETYWSPALGPVWVSIFAPGDTDSKYRGAFGFHLDANRATSPGSAGCVVFRGMSELKSFIGFFEKHQPDLLVVDYGYGTVRKPPDLESTETQSMSRVTLNGDFIGYAEIRNGTTYPTMGTLAKLLDLGLEWDGKTKTVELHR